MKVLAHGGRHGSNTAIKIRVKDLIDLTIKMRPLCRASKLRIVITVKQKIYF